MTRRKRRKKFRQKVFNGTNIVMVVCSILASYSAVTLSNAARGLALREHERDALASSAHRVAIAFEQYNAKRFTR